MRRYIRFLMAVLCLTIGMAGCKREEKVVEEDIITESYEREGGTVQKTGFSKGGDNFYLIVEPSGRVGVIPGKYWAKTIRKGKNQYSRKNNNMVKEVEVLRLELYDIHTGAEVKKIDIMPFLEPYFKKGYQFVSEGYMMSIEGRDYYHIWMDEVPNLRKDPKEKEELKNIYLRLDLDTEELTEIDEIPEPYPEDSSSIWIMAGTSFLDDNGFNDTGVENIDRIEDTSYIYIPMKHLPENSDRLYSLFPELKDMPREEGAYVQMYLSPITTNLEVIELLFSENQEAVFINPEEIGDDYVGFYDDKGKRHDITLEEYEEFQKEYYAYKEKVKQGEGDSLLPERN